jgi:serine protease Do
MIRGLAPHLVCGAALLMCGAASAASPAAKSALSWAVTVDGDGVYGSGVLLDPAGGLVVTNLHVVAAMKRPRVTFADGASMSGEVIDSDRALDVALVRIPSQRARPAPLLADPDGAGEEIYAVGFPRKLAFTMSRGIVSYVGRLLDGVRYLQTDLPMNEGNSGGPVVNARGELLGLMSFVYRGAQGLSFALPARAARERFRRWF